VAEAEAQKLQPDELYEIERIRSIRERSAMLGEIGDLRSQLLQIRIETRRKQEHLQEFQAKALKRPRNMRAVEEDECHRPIEPSAISDLESSSTSGPPAEESPSSPETSASFSSAKASSAEEPSTSLEPAASS
jgi:hypothetical protein